MRAAGTDLAVLGQDPSFGGGGAAQGRAFLDAARALGREPRLVFDPHPRLHGNLITWRRIEALRQLSARRELAAELGGASSVWVVTTLAASGAAAARSGRPYCSWVGTTIASEWAARAPGLGAGRRLAAGASLPLLKRLERETLRGSTRLYATSASSRRDLAAAADLRESDIGLLPIPVDPARFRPAADATWESALAARRAVFVGRADDPRKNLPLLLEVARLLPDVVIRLVGKPPVGALPPNVTASGEVADVGAELRRHAVFVLPSLQEGFGIAAAEALSAGLPVATTPCGGPEELIRESGGGIVATGLTAEALAEALEGVFAGARAMRAAGQSHVQREHSPERFRELLARELEIS